MANTIRVLCQNETERNQAMSDSEEIFKALEMFKFSDKKKHLIKMDAGGEIIFCLDGDDGNKYEFNTTWPKFKSTIVYMMERDEDD